MEPSTANTCASPSEPGGYASALAVSSEFGIGMGHFTNGHLPSSTQNAQHTSIIGNSHNTVSPTPPIRSIQHPTSTSSAPPLTMVSNSSTSSSESRPITLDVGGRIFRTYSVTLQDSEWLHAYIERWLPPNSLDSPLFIDADLDVFEHILRYLRRQEVFPLFWSKSRGFDYDLYNRLEAEAGHFGIPMLEDWIKEKKYLQAVTVKRSAPVTQLIERMGEEKELHNTEYERYTVNRTNRIYICPRGIPVHRGKREACGMACEKARGDTPLEYVEEEYLQFVTIAKTIEFDRSVCSL